MTNKGGKIMARAKKLSSSRVSAKSLSVKSKPLSAKTARKLAYASKKADARIAANNQVYASTNSHASYYATK